LGTETLSLPFSKPFESFLTVPPPRNQKPSREEHFRSMQNEIACGHRKLKHDRQHNSVLNNLMKKAEESLKTIIKNITLVVL
jgi:septal ring factor EnvC (AmiA/AmiB activator)